MPISIIFTLEFNFLTCFEKINDFCIVAPIIRSKFFRFIFKFFIIFALATVAFGLIKLIVLDMFDKIFLFLR